MNDASEARAFARESTVSNPRPKVVVVCSPKGGVGKTTIASNLLVRAAQCELRALGVDLDRQATLAKWFAARPQEARSFQVVQSSLDRWPAQSSRLLHEVDEAGRPTYDLIVVDTPPSVEDHMLEVRNLLEDADLTIIPTKAGAFDLRSTMPWGQTLTRLGHRAAMVLNQVNRQATSWQVAQRAMLRERLIVCPEVLPTGEDVSRYLDQGLALLDLTKVRGDLGARFEAVYDYVAREVSL